MKKINLSDLVGIMLSIVLVFVLIYMIIFLNQPSNFKEEYSTSKNLETPSAQQTDENEQDSRNEIQIEEEEETNDLWERLCERKPLSCGCPPPTKYKNDKVAVICENCGDEEDELLQRTLEYQTVVYDCLKDYFGYELNSNAEPLRYKITSVSEVEDTRTGRHGNADYCNVINTGFIGIAFPGDTNVRLENIRADVHESAHVFTHSLSKKGTVPRWFSEGISIYTDGRIQCHPKQGKGLHTMNNFAIEYLYIPLIEGDRRQFKNEAHYLGEMFDIALEIDYDCDVNCFFEIVRDLRESCGEVEDCKVDNEKIKESAEEVVGQDLSELFDLLELDY